MDESSRLDSSRCETQTEGISGKVYVANHPYSKARSDPAGAISYRTPSSQEAFQQPAARATHQVVCRPLGTECGAARRRPMDIPRGRSRPPSGRRRLAPSPEPSPECTVGRLRFAKSGNGSRPIRSVPAPGCPWVAGQTNTAASPDQIDRTGTEAFGMRRAIDRGHPRRLARKALHPRFRS